MGGGALLSNVVIFARLLRRAGLDVPPTRVPEAALAVDCVGVRTRADLRATLRAVFVHRHDDFATFDAAFDLFWRATAAGGELPLVPFGPPPRVDARHRPGAGAGLELEGLADRSGAPLRLAVGAYSPVEISRTKHFADFSPDEMRRAEAIVARAASRLGVRRTRRWKRAAAGGVDLRRVVRGSVMRGGEPIDLPRRARAIRPRPVVALCDVSGSMERYSRMLLQFVWALGRSSPAAESFVFATRLTRVTRQVRSERARTDRRPAGAGLRLPLLARAVGDAGGGTRIGESLRAFNVHWARRALRHGPVVLIVSDGWDRGDPALLRRELLRLRRGCHRLVWLNPLLGTASYEPLTRGMQAALDVVDDFLPVHNLASLDELVRRLAIPPRTWTSRATTPTTPR
jgi:uncharacterized protein